jgi:hypothetical protein
MARSIYTCSKYLSAALSAYRCCLNMAVLLWIELPNLQGPYGFGQRKFMAFGQ